MITHYRYCIFLGESRRFTFTSVQNYDENRRKIGTGENSGDYNQALATLWIRPYPSRDEKEPAKERSSYQRGSGYQRGSPKTRKDGPRVCRYWEGGEQCSRTKCSFVHFCPSCKTKSSMKHKPDCAQDSNSTKVTNDGSGTKYPPRAKPTSRV